MHCLGDPKTGRNVWVAGRMRKTRSSIPHCFVSYPCNRMSTKISFLVYEYVYIQPFRQYRIWRKYDHNMIEGSHVHERMHLELVARALRLANGVAA